MIQFQSVDVALPHALHESHSVWIGQIIKYFKKKTGEVFFLFCSDSYLHHINLQFLEHDTFTDIITFDLREKADYIQCEIYISVERIVENAEIQANSFNNELDRVLCHGILHLVGYKDGTQKEKTEMRKMEEICLALRPEHLKNR